MIGNAFSGSFIQAMYVENQSQVVAASDGFNGQQIDISKTYTFSTTGEHRIKVVFYNDIVNLIELFYNCKSLIFVDLSNLDTSNTIYMDDMFYGCISLKAIDLLSLDTNKSKDTSGMFYKCSSLTSLDVSNFNTSNVTDMKFMFGSCSSLTSLDVSNFNTSNVTDMLFMFSGCSSLTSLDVSNFDTSKVTSMSGMFYNCPLLTSLDLSNFDTSNVVAMYEMFEYCSNLLSVTMIGDVSKVTKADNMFDGITNIGVFFYNSEYDYSLILASIPSTWTSVGTTENIKDKDTAELEKFYNYALSLGSAGDTVEFPISIKVGDYLCKKAYLSGTDEVVFIDDNTGSQVEILTVYGFI